MEAALLLLVVAGCSGSGDWPEIGSSRDLIAASGTLAPAGGLTRRRVADGPEVVAADPVQWQADDVWPHGSVRQNTLADFERSLRDGTIVPAPSRDIVP